MKHLVMTFLVVAVAASNLPLAASAERDAFSCDFTTELGKQWKLIDGKWELNDGCLQQTDPKPADPTKAILVIGDGEDLSSDVVVIAKLRLDSWKDGEWARAGISVCSDPTSGHGFNLVFHQGRLEFVHDYVAWGPGVEFPYRAGTWYWMKLAKRAGQLQAKAWPKEDTEKLPMSKDYDAPHTIPVRVGGHPIGSAHRRIITVRPHYVKVEWPPKT